MSQTTVKEEAAKEGDSDAGEFWESFDSDDEGPNETEEAMRGDLPAGPTIRVYNSWQGEACRQPVLC